MQSVASATISDVGPAAGADRAAGGAADTKHETKADATETDNESEEIMEQSIRMRAASGSLQFCLQPGKLCSKIGNRCQVTKSSLITFPDQEKS